MNIGSSTLSSDHLARTTHKPESTPAASPSTHRKQEAPSAKPAAAATDSGRTNARSGDWFGQVVAKFVPLQAQAQSQSQQPDRVDQAVRAAREAIAAVDAGQLGELEHIYLQTALESLSDQQLRSVIDGASQGHVVGNTRSYDPSTLSGLLDAAARNGRLSEEQKLRLTNEGTALLATLAERPDETANAQAKAARLAGSIAALIGSSTGASSERKADLFESVSTAWARFAGHDRAVDATIATALEGLLKSDTNGVTTALETEYREGAGITTFVTQMIAQGRADELKSITAQLQLGNDLQGDPVVRFEAKDAHGNYRDAQVLGYFVGAVYAGVSQLNADKDKTAGVLSDIFDVTSILTGLGGKVVDAVKFGSKKWVDHTIDAYKAGNLDLRNAIAQIAYPSDGNGKRYEGAAAETVYDAAVGRVIDNQA